MPWLDTSYSRRKATYARKSSSEMRSWRPIRWTRSSPLVMRRRTVFGCTPRASATSPTEKNLSLEVGWAAMGRIHSRRGAGCVAPEKLSSRPDEAHRRMLIGGGRGREPALRKMSDWHEEDSTRPVMARPSRYDGSRLRLCGR